MIHLVRHGRTRANADGLLLGRRDPPLDEVGVAQAAALADALVGSGASRVVTSPLERCRATAVAIAAVLDVDVDEDERWIELDYGDLDGTALAAVPTETWAAWRADVRWRPPGGETLAELGERVRAACEDLAAAGGDVVVVSHVSPIKAAAAWALGVGDDVAWRLFVSPGSLSRIAVGAGVASLHLWNRVP